jgi:hypothetical protein
MEFFFDGAARLITMGADPFDENQAALASVEKVEQYRELVGQSFHGEAGKDVERVWFKIKRTGVSSSDIRAALYAHTGTYGAGGKATGSALAVSDWVTDSEVPTSEFVWIEFVFSTPYTMSAVDYVICLEDELGVQPSYEAECSTDAGHSGNACYFSSLGGIWSALTKDVRFKLYTETSDDTTQSNNMDVKDLYSRWKEWVKDTDEAANLIAFVAIGGNDIDASAGTKIPTYLYLVNGWSIRPQEADYTLAVSNGILLRDGGGDPFVDTLGAFTVRINYQQPVQAISVGIGDIYPDLSNIKAMRLLLDALALGKVIPPGALPGTLTIRDKDDTKDRVVATVDADGSREVTAYDAE